MKHFADVARIALGQYMRLTRHLFLARGLLHEQMARGRFAPNNFEVALAAAHFESFFCTGVSFEFHRISYLSGDNIMNRLNPCFLGA